MIERIWSGRNLLYLPLLIFSLLYGLVSNILRLSYRCGWRHAWNAPVPIVVVGNITVGGNGKTPVVIWLVQALQHRGFRVGVVSRGYGGKAEHYPLVLGPQTTAEEAGDEPVLIYQRTLAKVAVAPMRRLAVEALVSTGEIDIIIADDGLQHYALARDCEIVVVDGERRFGNGWWLPAGPMRERRSRLQNVTAVICNGGVPHMDELTMRLVPSNAINLQSGKKCAVSELAPVVAIAGIGHPSRFFTMIRQHGARIQREIAFADHQNYSAATLNALASDDQTILLMTEKDAVKVRSFAAANWWYIPVNAELPVAESQVLLDKISALITR